jgi:hypothetical protein
MMTTPESLHRACRQAFHAMCQYHADHISYQEPTAAQRAEYAHLEAVYVTLQRTVDDHVIAAYEQAWTAAHR